VRALCPDEDVVKHLNANEQKALARRLGVALGAANDAERAQLLQTNLTLHRNSMTDGIIETRTACYPDYVVAVNKAKRDASELARRKVANGLQPGMELKAASKLSSCCTQRLGDDA
jgi:hypothetical protein